MQHSFARISQDLIYTNPLLMKDETADKREKNNCVMNCSLSYEEQRVCDMATD